LRVYGDWRRASARLFVKLHPADLEYPSVYTDSL